jgi:hypothetical protein
MKRINVTILPVVLLSIVVLAGCVNYPATGATSLYTTLPPTPVVPVGGDGPAVPDNLSATANVVGGPFIPGEVLAGVPVFPGATPTTSLRNDFGPPSYPSEIPLYGGDARPGYQSASAQYTADAAQETILGWYVSQLEILGYRHHGEGGSGSPTMTHHSIAFFLPSQPLVSVQVHVYNGNGSPATVIELLVTYTVPLPKPAGESLPDDIGSVTVAYLPGTGDAVTKNITDALTVADLVGMVNALPVRPDYITTGPGPGWDGPYTLYTLVFHSASQGDLTVTGTTVPFGVHFGDYPVLDDPHQLLKEAVQLLAKQ